MLYYDRFDVSEGINVNKTRASKKCTICHYRNFLDKKNKFQPTVGSFETDFLYLLFFLCFFFL